MAPCAAVNAEAERHLFDAVCLIRGGGAVTDLYWLNDLTLARSVCLMPIPVLTGIGHERDSTILDEVAHRAFDTPSKVIGYIGSMIRANATAAAEDHASLVTGAHRLIALVEKNVEERPALLQSRSATCLERADSALEQLMAVLRPTVANQLEESTWLLERVYADIQSGFDQAFIEALRGIDGYLAELWTHSRRLQDLADQEVEAWRFHLVQSAVQQLEFAKQSVESLGREILGLGPAATLARGFALVRGSDGATIGSAGQAQAQTELNLEFQDGIVRVIVPKPT